MLKYILALMLCCVAVPAYATVDWDEDFEYANNQAMVGVWDSSCAASPYGAGVMDVSTTRAHGGSKSLKLTYPAPDSSGGCFMNRPFTGSALSETMYTRFWIFLDNFTAHTVGSKVAFHGQNGAYPSFWWGMYASPVLSIAMQAITLADGSKSTPPAIAGGAIPTNQWICIETRLTMSSPGGADGIMQQWISGVQTMNITNQRMRPTSDQPDLRKANAKFGFVSLYRQHGVGAIYYDDYAVSRDARIGCGVQIPGDTTPPSPPTAFTVQ